MRRRSRPSANDTRRMLLRRQRRPRHNGSRMSRTRRPWRRIPSSLTCPYSRRRPWSDEGLRMWYFVPRRTSVPKWRRRKASLIEPGVARKLRSAVSKLKRKKKSAAFKPRRKRPSASREKKRSASDRQKRKNVERRRWLVWMKLAKRESANVLIRIARPMLRPVVLWMPPQPVAEADVVGNMFHLQDEEVVEEEEATVGVADTKTVVADMGAADTRVEVAVRVEVVGGTLALAWVDLLQEMIASAVIGGTAVVRLSKETVGGETRRKRSI
mmetsp:Transcript_19873/g.43345  ORF Transcript_19873/g.43345 Transcript_19873/m.43345 type:complete len:270 (-) Transcript_19873:304-1113(-)